MEGKAPGTLTEWVRLYTKNGWTSGKEILHIELELLDHLGPVTLEMVIEKAQELKADYEAEDPPEDELEYEEKAEDWF